VSLEAVVPLTGNAKPFVASRQVKK